MSNENDFMEIVNTNANDCNGTASVIEFNGVVIQPVPPNAEGIGLPFAPVNWPHPGDNWRWKVGRRTALSGYYQDRYLYTPNNFQRGKGKRKSFASKLTVEQYVREQFPDKDVDAFFASFCWKIPALNRPSVKEPEEMVEYSESESQSDSIRCKAGNKNCNSLVEVETRECSLKAMPCDLCCSEQDFCRDCCCILCCKSVKPIYGGYSYIKCEAIQDDGFICAHLAHIDCALRTYMAGTVGGTIALDAAYHCRRCDERTDLVPHISRSIQACESIESRDDIEKILNVGICVLRGSQRESAKIFLDCIESAKSKLKSGISIEGIWKMEDSVTSVTAFSLDASDHDTDTLEAAINHHDPLSSNFQTQCIGLEDEIYNVLQSLRRSQETEYRMAEEILNTQKKHLLNLYEQLHKERSDLTSLDSSAAPDALLDAILKRRNQILLELKKLRDMEEVAKGFGQTSRAILKEHFGIENDS